MSNRFIDTLGKNNKKTLRDYFNSIYNINAVNIKQITKVLGTDNDAETWNYLKDEYNKDIEKKQNEKLINRRKKASEKKKKNNFKKKVENIFDKFKNNIDEPINLNLKELNKQLAPQTIPEIVTSETLKGMGFSARGGKPFQEIRTSLIGKDIRDPAQAAEVKTILEKSDVK